jgi:polyhydroxybutyrate depolymerase
MVSRILAGSLLSVLLLHCSPGASSDAASGGSGGQSAAGGGGVAVTGGTTGAGGLVSASGGQPAVGGSVSTGGSVGVGGSLTADGGASSGGAASGGQASGGGSAVECPSSVLAAGNTTKTVTVGTDERSYVLHVPASYDGSEPVPLILDFHGLTGSGQGESTSSPYPAVTDADGVIMAFPSGASGPSGAAWNVGPCCVAGVDDVAFARALVAQVQGVACIDPQRIYAVGFSMGGGMSHYLACHAADLFAAVAPAAFDLLEENVEDCLPSRPLTIVSFRSTNDSVVPYAGGYSDVVPGMAITFLGAEATRDQWAELNECTGAAMDTGNGCTGYSACAAGTSVTLCTSANDHAPGDASIAWPILKAQTLP